MRASNGLLLILVLVLEYGVCLSYSFAFTSVVERVTPRAPLPVN